MTGTEKRLIPLYKQTGRWEKHGKHDWRCSVCKRGVPYSFTGHNYCHNCGSHNVAWNNPKADEIDFDYEAED